MVTKPGLYKLLTGVVLLAVLTSFWLRRRHHATSLPYSDGFAGQHAEEWTPIGGTWSFKGGAVINRSDERGAKLVTGSEDWQDYHLHADLQLLGTIGDAGILIRIRDATDGINGYSGYYAGLQLRDGALILGSSHDDWVAVPPVAVPGGIHPGSWYSLDVIAVGCTVGAHVRALPDGGESWTALTQRQCWKAGRVGLRSVGLGAAWKNVSVVAATDKDLRAILQHVPEVREPQIATREDQFSATMLAYYGTKDAMQRAVLQREMQVLDEESSSVSPVRSIGTLRELSPHDRTRIRGVVSLLDPVYVQDATGGTEIESPNALAVNVGDEIEVVGTLQSGDNVRLQADRVKVLSGKAPLIPVSISSTQAAGGEFEATYVELRGSLDSVQSGRDGEYLLEMDDGTQRFEVVVPPGLNSHRLGSWDSGSLMRVRGVCSETNVRAFGNTAFVLLAPGDAEIEVISGPPWNRGLRLFILIALGLLFLGAGVAAYLKAERSRLHAASSEREQIAMEIHDTLAQSFAGVSFNLQSMKKIMEDNSDTPHSLLLRIRQACSMAAEAHREASDRMGSLQRATSDEDILEQLKRSAQSMLNGTAITVAMETTGTPRSIAPINANALVQIGRELIANSLRHSGATQLRLHAQYTADRLLLSVVDNGGGFDHELHKEGFGLRSVRVRAREIGGVVTVLGTPGKGTAVTIESPYGAKRSLFALPRKMMRQQRRT